VIYNGKVYIIRGKITSDKQSEILFSLEKSYPKKIINFTTPTKHFLSEKVKQINTKLIELDLTKYLVIEQHGDDLWIRGKVKSKKSFPSQKLQLKKIYSQINFDVEFKKNYKETIYIRVFLLKISKNQSLNLGLNWEPLINNILQWSKNNLASSVGITPNLNSLAGKVRILSQPEITIKVPGKAELFSGGELPIRTRNKFQSQVKWKAHGLSLKLIAKELLGNEIKLEVSTEISHLDYEHANTEEIPSIKTNKINTQITATIGKPIMLTGLYQQESFEHENGIFLLKDIPLIGSIFGSKRNTNKNSELVAILLPQRMPPPTLPSSFNIAFPKGPIPPPRNWVSPQNLFLLKQSEDYPWNTLR